MILIIFFSFFVNTDPMGLKISRGYFSHLLQPISTKLYNKYYNKYPGDGEILAIKILGDLPNIAKLMGLLNTGHMGLEISKCYSPYNFHQILA